MEITTNYNKIHIKYKFIFILHILNVKKAYIIIE